MKAIVNVLSKRWFLLSIAFLMLALVVWWGGPYLALGTLRPFETVGQRLLGIMWLAVLFILWEVLRRFRIRRASSQLAQDVSTQGAPASQPSAEATQLRARFDEAIAALRSSKGKAFNLYELPWYIIIGPPGAGKTTVIANSGLNFPLAKKFGAQALRGVGGTRNCDWWFTDEAVLLDTAGRYTTQDSDADSDQAGWTEFLSLLRKHRGRRPINGVLVAMSAPDLFSQSDAERARHVQAVRDRLEELGRELKIDLPVYLFLTKLDLIAGFTEFFDDFNQEHRGQVWGVTFPLEVSRAAQGPAQLPEEFDLLIERLNSRLMQRLESERDVRRRTLLFTFPRQFAALRRNLTDFVSSTFSAEGAPRKLQLRGVYFTSGTQEGTPIDRMIGALARTFGLNMRAVATQQSQGRAYFIQRLLKEVLFKESGLAGINRRMELRQGLLNIGIYVTVVLVLVVGLVGFSVSYRKNRDYLASLQPPVDQLRSLSSKLDAGEPLTAGLQRLDAFAKATTVAEQHRDDVPFGMRWGMYQGRSLGNASRDAYLRELNAVLLPAIADHFRNRLIALASEPDKLYEYLKAYLMLAQPQNRDPNQLLYIGNLEWQRVFANDPATLERFSVHFNALIADSDHMQPAKMDTDTVERARISLAQASLPALMYSRLKLGYVDDKRAINLGREMALGGEVFVRKSGASLSDPFPAIYTRTVFKEISNIGKVELVGQFVDESWVMGNNVADIANSPLLMTRLMQLYEQDYIRAWDTLLGDLMLNPTSDPQQAAQQWGLLAAPTSPLKRLLELVRTHTALVEPTKDKEPNRAQTALKSALGSMNRVLGADQTPQAPPGTTITKYFEPLHRVLQGSPPPIELTLQKFAAIQRVMSEINALGGPPPLQTAGQLNAAFKDLALHAKTLPAPLANVVDRATGSSSTVVETTLNNDFMNGYGKVVAECRLLAQGKYPVADLAIAPDMTLADFSKLFAPNGTYDTFFRETMQAFVDTSGRTWRWRRGAESLGGAGIPRQFQRAAAIRDIYFPAGNEPKVMFEVSTESADETVRRATLIIDAQKYEFRNGPKDSQTRMTWPGQSGGAEITFDLAGAFFPNLAEAGPWALYRLLGRGDVQPRPGNKFIATFTLNGSSVRLQITAASTRNPFVKDNPLKDFSCQG